MGMGRAIEGIIKLGAVIMRDDEPCRHMYRKDFEWGVSDNAARAQTIQDRYA
jgi:hypothetical protein